MTAVPESLSRSALLLGDEALHVLMRTRVIIFGVGGVGSWCAEALIRSGVRFLTMVDDDVVAPSNINRQLPATHNTIGLHKVEVLRSRLLTIAPDAHITALACRYTADTQNDFHLDEYDYVIDAIDSIDCKAALILEATACIHTQLLCSMGAARRIDPTQVRVAEFQKVQGDALCKALRNRFKKHGTFPKKKFRCVFSLEPAMQNIPSQSRTNGSLAPVTGTFGLTLASIVINDALTHLPNPLCSE